MNTYSISGVVTVDPQGYGYIQPDPQAAQFGTVYINRHLVRRYAIKTGARLAVQIRPTIRNELYCPVMQVQAIDGSTVATQALRD